MALHINLYNEIQKQDLQRRRDPVKLAGLGAVLLLIAFVVYYMYRANATNAAELKLHNLQGEWATLEPQTTAAHARELELMAQQKVNLALVNRLQGRFYWAQFLERFAEAIPANIQITTMEGGFQSRKSPVGILIGGVAAGQQPRSVAEQFRLGIQSRLSSFYGEVSANFDANSLEDSPATVQIGNQILASATFRIRLQFNADAPTPTPTPTPLPNSRERKKTP